MEDDARKNADDPELNAREEAESDAEEMRDETGQVLQKGPRAGNKAGALAFLALVIVGLAVLRFYLADSGSDAYFNRLDSELVTHAELSLAAARDDTRIAVVPSWPFRLYDILRRDIAIYAAAAAIAAYVWGLAARARARRDAFLVHEKLAAEVLELRGRLEKLEYGVKSGADGSGQRKG